MKCILSALFVCLLTASAQAGLIVEADARLGGRSGNNQEVIVDIFAGLEDPTDSVVDVIAFAFELEASVVPVVPADPTVVPGTAWNIFPTIDATTGPDQTVLIDGDINDNSGETRPVDFLARDPNNATNGLLASITYTFELQQNEQVIDFNFTRVTPSVLSGLSATGFVIFDGPPDFDPINAGETYSPGQITLAGLSAIPEPSSLLLSGLAITGLGFVRRRKR